MKKIIILFFVVFAAFSGKTQEKLCYNVFYTAKQAFAAQSFNNILVVCNAPHQAIDEMRKIAKDEKYNMIFFYDIFPPVKNYSDDEISEQIVNYEIDGILFLSVAGPQALPFDFSFGSYEYVKNLGTDEGKKITNLEGYFIDPSKRKEIIFSCQGSVNDASIPSTFKVFANILKKFPDIGVKRPEKLK